MGFQRGDVILAPCRGDRGDELRAHWMIVLDVDDDTGELLAVFLTSVKEGLYGGQYALTTDELSAASLTKRSRFDPNTVWIYGRDCYDLIKKGIGHMSEKMLGRISIAVYKRRPKPHRYRVLDA